MIPVDTLSVFFAASILLALAPGPDNIFVLTQSAIHGWRVGLAVTLGLCTGLLVHTSAVAMGVAALFQASTIAFAILKLAGATYLLYLAWRSFQATAERIDYSSESTVSLSRLYRRGIVMNVTNPKVTIFFLAFLPQFADAARGSLTLQMFLLGFAFIVAALLVFGLISIAADAIGARLRKSPSVQTVMNRIAGAVFAGLAFKLAMAER